MSAKQTVRDLLERLPDDCSLDDVLYHLYVVRSIEGGETDAQRGRVLSHKEVADALRKKWAVGAAE